MKYIGITIVFLMLLSSLAAAAGNGSDGNLTCVSGTTNLELNKVYNFQNFVVGPGCTISTANISGAVLYVLVQNDANISGQIILSNKLSPGMSNSTFTGDNLTLKAPSTGQGGGGAGSVDGFGGGGMGSSVTCYGSGNAYAGSGRPGGTPFGTSTSGAYCTGSNCVANSSSASGNSSASGGAACTWNDGYGCYESATGGAGGNTYSANGGDCSGSFWHDGSWSCSYTWSCAGGGGAGGIAGTSGIHFYLKANKINFTGVINTSGTNGGKGGNGGKGYYWGGELSASGSGGGAGGGGNAGNISLYGASSLIFSGTVIKTGGAAGAVGQTYVPGYGWAETGGAYGYAGTNGILTANPTIDSSRLSPNGSTTSNNILMGYCQGSNANLYTMNYTYVFYKNGTVFYTNTTSTRYNSSVEVNVANITSLLNFTHGSNWTLQCLATDSTGSNSGALNSSVTQFNATALYTTPTPDNDSLVNLTTVVNVTTYGVVPTSCNLTLWNGTVKNMTISGQSCSATIVFEEGNYNFTANVSGGGLSLSPGTRYTHTLFVRANYSAGISGLSFRPAHAYSQNVEPVNQSYLKPLYVLNNTQPFTVQVVGRISADISGFSMKCTDSAYNYSLAKPITSTWSNLTTILPYNPALSACYQETATITTACGATGAGHYSASENWNDGNWATYTPLSNTAAYVNYSVSTFASNATMQLKFGNATTTNTSNVSVWACANNSSTAQFRLQYYNQSFGNGSDGSFMFVGTPTMCYQETANVSTACGGLATGSYACSGNFNVSSPCSLAYDEIWTPGSSPVNYETAYIYMNYTVPATAQNLSIWQTKIYNVAINTTMNNSCWGSTLQFRIKSNYTSNTTANTTGACYNGTAWVNLWETSSNQNYRLFNEEAMWWNMSNSYGNLVNGTDYNVSGNTLYLNLDHAYRFTNFVLGPNTTLTTTTPNGTVMIILANGTLSVSGTINLTGKGNWTAANYTYGFRTFSAKSAGTFGKGGNGGTTGTYLSCIGGVGGTGNGINGTGGASVGSCAMSDYSCINGNSGGPSAGGSGVASTFGGGVCSGIASGAGANAFGANGADGTVSGSPYARLAAAGGGGAGGIPGVSGASVYLSADVLIVNGSIFTNGLPGMAGGNGGNGAWKYGSEFTVSGGDGGNGGDGGKGGDVYFDYRTATLSGSSNISGASGGLGGIGGTGAGMTETPSGNNGTAGAVGTSGAATYTQLGSSAFCYYNSTWNSIFQIPQAQNMPSLFEEGIYWTLAAQSGQGNLWCWADFNNPNPHGQSFNISINGNRYG